MSQPPTVANRVPTGRTAQRLEWRFLPPHVRNLIERRIGSPVTDASSQGGGFTPGFASVLTCVDGSRHFVKAASAQAQPIFAESYREEARKLLALPEAVPAPRLLWSVDDDWVVLETAYVEGRAPRRPWREAELASVLDTLEATTRVLTPAPPALGLATFAEEFAAFAAAWDDLETRGDLPHADETAALAHRFADVTGGDSLVHTDIRDDNVIVAADGGVWFCDWNWPVRGAAWLDMLFLLIQPRGDGLNVDSILAHRELTRDVPAEHIDIVLALLAGYFTRQADQPVPPTSPHLRNHQAWMRDVIWAWLAERRDWSARDLGAPRRPR